MAYSVFSNATIATSGRLLNALLGVVATALITRVLGPDSYGAYTLLLSFGVLLQLTADFGLYLTLTREISQQPEREAEYITQIFSLRTFLFLLAAGIGVLLARYIPSLASLTLPLLVVLSGLLFQSLSQLLMGVYQKYTLVWRATVADLLGRLVQIAGILIAVFFVGTLTSVAIAFTAGAAAAFLLHAYLLPIRRPSFIGFEWTVWKHFLTTSWPLGLMLILNAVYFRIDTLLLSFFRPAVEVGWYGLAYRLIESGLFFPAMLGGLLLPKISAVLESGDRAQARHYIEEGLYILLVLIIPLMFFLVTIPDFLVKIVSGEDFLPAAPLLRILSLALAVMFFGNLFGFSLIALGRHMTLLILYAVLVVFNTAGNLLFIPQWGSVAAAWTTVATEVLAAGTAAVLVYRVLPYQLQWSVYTPLLKATGASLLLFMLLPAPLPLVLRVGLTLLAYGGILGISGGLSLTRLPLLRES